MREFLAPFWEFLFEAFGVFGIGIALGILGFGILLAYLLLVGIWALIGRLFTPKRKAVPRRSVAVPPSVSLPKRNSSAAPTVEKKQEPYRSPTLQDFLKRAEQGEAYAQCCCGSIYEHGDGVPVDMEKAIHWYQTAGDAGHVLSNYKLGMMYLEGRGVKKDLALARERLTLAAEGEDDTAQYQLALIYSEKNELLCKEKGYTSYEEKKADAEYIRNEEKYKYWLKKAAANGNYDAEYILY